MDFSALAGELLKGVSALGGGQLAMLAVGLFLIGLAVVKKYEPLLLLPIGAGCLLANLPLSGLVVTTHGADLPDPPARRRIALRFASHPVPDEGGAAAATEMLEAVRGLAPQDLVLFLVSGGERV